MEAAPSNQEFSEFSPASSGDALSLATSAARRRLVLLLTVGLGLFLRLYEISSYPFAGDEYNSIAGAKDIGLNWNSVIYAILTRYWIRWGDNELWLRLPAAIFGTISVIILFKIGERLGGWRTGVVAGLLAATSPFNIYHSQEMRFYSLFILASAVFILTTINYVDGKKTNRKRGKVLVAALFLCVSHFLGILALCVQSVAAVLANKPKWSRWVQVSLVSGLALLIGLPLIPGLQQKLWQFYSAHAGVTEFSLPKITPISTVNFAKVALAFYTFLFGYHVYPLRLTIVILGLCASAVLLCAGIVRLWKESRWRLLPFFYLLSVIAVYFVLNSIGGRVSSVIGPRHAAFVWPVFIILLAIGLTSFNRLVSCVLLASLLTVNGFSIWSGWQKDWTYGPTEDYRIAGAYASRWNANGTAMLVDGRSRAPIDFYFPKNIPRIDSLPYLQGDDLSDLNRNERLVFITDDWQPDRRRRFDVLLSRLSDTYTCIDGRVDYPLFEYVLERKSSSELSGYSVRGQTNQVFQPITIYGLEFQDLILPVSVKVKDFPLMLLGAYGLPDSQERNELVIPLARPVASGRLILLSNVVGTRGLESGQQIADLTIEDKSKNVLRFPLRLGSETASWDQQCERLSPCETVFKWHKRMALVGQNGYEGAFRDFPAGLHGVIFEFPQGTEATKITFHYLVGSGHLYVWGIALPA
jgi:Dolichyl-phosphate-mannose-protein mannosyltransferase